MSVSRAKSTKIFYLKEDGKFFKQKTWLTNNIQRANLKIKEHLFKIPLKIKFYKHKLNSKRKNFSSRKKWSSCMLLSVSFLCLAYSQLLLNLLHHAVITARRNLIPVFLIAQRQAVAVKCVKFYRNIVVNFAMSTKGLHLVHRKPK